MTYCIFSILLSKYSLWPNRENLFNNQELFLWVIISHILISLMFESGVILFLPRYSRVERASKGFEILLTDSKFWKLSPSPHQLHEKLSLLTKLINVFSFLPSVLDLQKYTHLNFRGFKIF